MERPTKLMAISKQNYADVRFSDLPDEVVHHILFFLLMKDLARLSVVSKRCRVLCISNPKLFLSNIHKSGRSHFNSFVDRLMALRCLYGVKTELFVLRWSFDGSVEDEECRVGTWLQHAVNSGGVTDVRLKVIHPRQPFALPLCLLGCNSLRFLKVKAMNGFFKLPSAPYFSTNIQRLLLDSVRIEKDCHFGELFSSLKSLKVLRLNKISGIKSMTITGSSIEILSIRSTDRDVDLCDIDIQQLDKLYNLYLVWMPKFSSRSSLKISAPNLRKFHLGGFAVDYYCIRDLPHLLLAAIGLRLPPRLRGNQASTKYNLDKVLHSVRKARRLNLLDCFVEALHKQGCLPFSFDNVKCLKVGRTPSVVQGLQLSSLFSLLKGTTNLEHLTLYRASLYLPLYSANHAEMNSFKMKYWQSQHLMFTHQLKRVTVELFDRENEIELIKYLLMNAEELEELFILFTVPPVSSYFITELKKYQKPPTKLIYVQKSCNKTGRVRPDRSTDLCN